MNSIRSLARFVRTLGFEQLPDNVISRSQAIVRDTIACAVSAAGETHVRNLADEVLRRGSEGTSTLLLDGRSADAADASLVNAVAACAFVLDEGHKYARGHVGTYVVSPVLAVAEEYGATGPELITALVAGYEASARLGIASRIRKGMHPSGTWGSVGAAAAVARLMDFDEEAIAETMNLAAPLSLATSWPAAAQGATVRDLFSGHGAANAIHAPRYVAAGFSAGQDDVFHVFRRIIGTRFDRRAAVAGFGTRWEILRNYFKIHSCCRNFQSAIDAALALKGELNISSDQIQSIHVETFRIPVEDNAARTVKNPLAARESLPISLALALVKGSCSPADFDMASIGMDEVQRLASIARITPDPEFDSAYPDQRPTRLTLTLTGGRVVTRTHLWAKGDPNVPLSERELIDKYNGLVIPRLGPRGAANLFAAIESLPAAPDLSNLTTAIQGLRKPEGHSTVALS